jgi:hypothetical protein
MGVTFAAEGLEQAEIGDLGLKVCIQQDVRRLHVPVDESWTARLVQILKPWVGSCKMGSSTTTTMEPLRSICNL